MFFFELIRFAKAWHVGTKVVEPDFFGVVFVGFSAGKKEDVCFYTLGIKDSGWQAEDCVQVTFVH